MAQIIKIMVPPAYAEQHEARIVAQCERVQADLDRMEAATKRIKAKAKSQGKIKRRRRK